MTKLCSVVVVVVTTAGFGCHHDKGAAYHKAEAERAAEVKTPPPVKVEVDPDKAIDAGAMQSEFKMHADHRLDEIAQRLDRFASQVSMMPMLTPETKAEYTQAASDLKAEVMKCKQTTAEKISSSSKSAWETTKGQIDDEIDMLDEKADRLLHQI